MYRFDKDTATPPTATCVGPCATTWPPLMILRGQSVFAAGVDPQLVGFIERADGSCQIAIGGTWFPLTPTGGRTR
nr:hypothetical protein [Nocardia brasiliensis]